MKTVFQEHRSTSWHSQGEGRGGAYRVKGGAYTGWRREEGYSSNRGGGAPTGTERGEPPALYRLPAVVWSYNNVALQHRQRRQHVQHVGAGSNFVGRWNQCVCVGCCCSVGTSASCRLLLLCFSILLPRRRHPCSHTQTGDQDEGTLSLCTCGLMFRRVV